MPFCRTAGKAHCKLSEREGNVGRGYVAKNGLEKGGIVNLVLVVDIGAAGEQRFPGFGVAAARSIHERSVGELFDDDTQPQVEQGLWLVCAACEVRVRLRWSDGQERGVGGASPVAAVAVRGEENLLCPRS